ncbi:MAG: hypothetical protein EYC62_09370 [Alphaproteobacteria bacterium]|nr:MAG: hypothetical protein EYC62_09370 [Alphaproteobacteria bacterium]
MTTYSTSPQSAVGILTVGHRRKENFLVTLVKVAASPFVRWHGVVTGRNRGLAVAAALLSPAAVGGLGYVIDRNVDLGMLDQVVSTSHSAACLGQINITDHALAEGMSLKIQFTPSNGGPRSYALLQGKPEIRWALSGNRQMVMQAKVIPQVEQAIDLVAAERNAANTGLQSLSEKSAPPHVVHYTASNNFVKLGNMRQVGNDLVIDVVASHVKAKQGENTPSFAVTLATSSLQATDVTGKIFLAALGALPEQKAQGPSAFAGPQHFVGGDQVAGIYGQSFTGVRQSNFMDTITHNPGTSFGSLIGTAAAAMVLMSRFGRGK